VEDRDYANGHLLPGPKQRNRDSQAALKAAYQRLTKTGVNGVYYCGATTTNAPWTARIRPTSASCGRQMRSKSRCGRY
jgi:hypothetical protein